MTGVDQDQTSCYHRSTKAQAPTCFSIAIHIELHREALTCARSHGVLVLVVGEEVEQHVKWQSLPSIRLNSGASRTWSSTACMLSISDDLQQVKARQD